MLNRRQMLQQSALLSLAPTVPGFLSHVSAAEDTSNDNILVVVQLGGGNDGLNTIVPFKDDGYLSNRKVLRLPEVDLIGIDDATAFHPAMKSMADLLEDSKLAIVQGAGYPSPNRSHDVSMAVWHSASTDQEDHTGLGWLGKALDGLPAKTGKPSSLLVADSTTPLALRGRKSVSATMDSLEDFRDIKPTSIVPIKTPASNVAQFLQQSTKQAYTTAAEINALSANKDRSASELSKLNSSLARNLQVVADLIDSDFGPRVYYVMQPGYDTHSDQLPTHARLLRMLSRAMKAFQADIVSTHNADRVLTLCFSEFGRQVKENGSAGTDHGTAGPVFLMGNKVKPGLHAAPADLSKLDDNAPMHTVDFRSVYATVLDQWMHVNSKPIVGENRAPFSLLS